MVCHILEKSEHYYFDAVQLSGGWPVESYVRVSVAPKPVAFQVTIKEAEGVSPFKPIENKEPLSECKIKQKLEMAEERRLVGSMTSVS